MIYVSNPARSRFIPFGRALHGFSGDFLNQRAIMEHKIKSSLSFMALALLLFGGITWATVLTPQEIAKRALDATVLLVMKDGNGQVLGFGSGFFVRPNQIATNYHVIEGATAGTAKRVGQETDYEITDFSLIDETHDLAILEVSESSVQPLFLGDSDAVVIGDTVYVTGNPKGYLEGTFSHGLISAIRELSTTKLFQLTAPISSGSSGGPVLNNKGEVIGVSVAQIRDGQNLNFAIPSNYLNSIASYIKGSAKYKLGLYQLAIEYYDTAIRLNPENALAYIWRGFANYELGQHTAAMKDCYTARLLKSRIRVQRIFGFREVNHRQYSHEIAEYNTAVQQNPDNALVYFWRGFANNDLAQYDAALADCDSAIRLQPDFALAYSERGTAKAALGHKIAALQDHDNAIRLKPDYVIFYLNRGNTKGNFGDFNAAIKDFDATILLNPNDGLAHERRGAAKAELRQYEAAIKDYDTAIRIQPDYAGAYCNRGISKVELGQYDTAIKDCDTAIRIQPDYALAYYKRGWTKAFLRQHGAAIQDYDTAIRLQPDYAEAYYGRGVANHNLGQRDPAIKDYDTAIEIQSEHALAYFNRGLAKHWLNRTREAEKDFKTALELVEQARDYGLKAELELKMKELH